MLRISKLTDYATLVATEMVLEQNDDGVKEHSASDIATHMGLPKPTVRKILKKLATGGVVCATRGAEGGYRLAQPAELISLFDVIVAMEGPIAITECSLSKGSCKQEGHCQVQSNWQRINLLIHGALKGITLADMSLASGGKIPLPQQTLNIPIKQALNIESNF